MMDKGINNVLLHIRTYTHVHTSVGEAFLLLYLARCGIVVIVTMVTTTRTLSVWMRRKAPKRSFNI